MNHCRLDGTTGSTILVAVAHPFEFKAIAQRAGKSNSQPPTRVATSGAVAFFEPVLTGLGEEGVVSTLGPLLSSGQRLPRLLLNLGFVGALHPDLRLGDWILADRVTRGRARSYSLAGTDIFSRARGFFKASPYRCHEGAVVSVERPVFSKDRKNLLAARRLLAVDMEAYSVSRTALDFGLPVLCLKLVSDYADEGTKETFQNTKNRLAQAMRHVLFDFLDYLRESDWTNEN